MFDRKEELAVPPKEIQPSTLAVDPLQSWMEGVERVRRCLNRATESDPRNYVEQICSTFLDNHNKDLIYEKVVRLGRLQKSAYRYENEVYALVGVAEEYERASKVVKEVNQVLSWAEEIFCYAMVDVIEVRDRYAAKEFMYQAN